MSIPKEKSQSIAILQNAGISNPLRLLSLLRRQISFLQLDLSGLTILTEAASGPYTVTPIIASLAGAKRVIAMTRNSHYATVDEVISQTRALELLCDVTTLSEIHTDRSLNLFSTADIVTNLGFVRPLDKSAIFAMKPTTVIPLMCEAWEFRPGDIDLDACNTRNIPVVGTNEDFPGLEIFSYSSFLCAKILFEAQIEIHKSSILVVSSDKFGVVIARHLSQLGANITRIDNLRDFDSNDLQGLDAVIVADYTRDDTIIGQGGDMPSKAFAENAMGTTIVQFAGVVNVGELSKQGIKVYPGVNLPPHRMTQTLAYLGPRPVLELHAAGLKVGELLLKHSGVLSRHNTDDRYNPLCMPLI
ncbi:hypothetical protein MASR2M66_18830 [Chloroflexota bacterium]